MPIILLLLAGCATPRIVDEIPGESLPPDQVLETIPVDMRDNVLNDANVPVTGLMCEDDIYAQYLRQKYSAESPWKKNPQQSHARPGNGKAAEVRVDLLADYYAFRALSQPRVGPANIPITINGSVKAWIDYLRGRGRTFLTKCLLRRDEARHYIVPALEAHGLSEDFIYVAMMESGLSNSAKSHARAVGPWQFMHGTARLFGLKIGPWVDERRDPVKATVAAARYLKDLYQEFGDWYLAIAAYNSGPGRIKQAISRTGSRDFWDLARTSWIRQETKQYVPKILAAIIIASDPTAHGFALNAETMDPVPSGVALVAHTVRLSEVASGLSLDEATLRHWNPELTRGIVPAGKGRPYSLRLPKHLEDDFAKIAPNLSSLEIRETTTHRVRPGDTLVRLARVYGTNVKNLQALNPNIIRGKLRVGQELAIPLPSATIAISTSPRSS